MTNVVCTCTIPELVVPSTIPCHSVVTNQETTALMILSC